MTNEARIHEIRTSDSIAVVFHSPFGLWYSFGIPHSGFVITEQSAGWTAKQRGRFLSSGFSLSSHQGRRGPGRGGLFALLGNPSPRSCLTGRGRIGVSPQQCAARWSRKQIVLVRLLVLDCPISD